MQTSLRLHPPMQRRVPQPWSWLYLAQHNN